jgi:peptidyl-prolyl cis-trans isomerase D
LQQYQRRLRQPFTNEQARAIGLDREVLQRLLSEAAIDEEARKLGLSVSDEALRAMIETNPNFRSKSGAFDPQLFASALRDNDMNERMFVTDLRKTALRQFIVAGLTAGIAAPKAATKAEADVRDQNRSIDYFVLPASAAGAIAPPSEEALKAFFNERKASYRAPEYRAIDVVALDPQTLANPAEVSDADGQAAYDKVAGKDPRYGSPEKRDLQQILFPNARPRTPTSATLRSPP